MADLAAGDVVYTEQAGLSRMDGASRVSRVFKLVFGNGTLTYPSGGVPLTKAKLGCPNNLDECLIMDASDGDGFVYKYNKEADTIKIYTTNLDTTTDGPLVELTAASSAIASSTTMYIKVVGY